MVVTISTKLDVCFCKTFRYSVKFIKKYMNGKQECFTSIGF